MSLVSLKAKSDHLLRHAAWFAQVTTLTLSLSSCRSVPQPEVLPLPPGEAVLQGRGANPQVAQAVERVGRIPAEPVYDEGMPIPLTNASPWAPPGIAGPWPRDEYLLDGGDRDVQANIGAEGELRGLELEDTVAVYDTIDGCTVIEPSNRVCLYAPRFAAVRKVESVIQSEQRDHLIAVNLPVQVNIQQEDQLASTAIQPEQPEGEIGVKQPSLQRTQEGTLRAISRQPLAAIDGGFAVYENLLLMRQGMFAESEKARLSAGLDAAITWTHEKAVQVVLDGQEAMVFTGGQTAQVTYRVDTPNHPCLRVIKIASKKTALPGEVVDFTIRFDNMGDQAIQRVVLIDNLTTRLEYVPQTAQSSREAEFSTEQNEGDSLVLRWEFTEPLPVGQGGLVRFHCRVR